MELSYFLVQHLTELVDVLLVLCRDEQAVVVELCHPGLLEVFQRNVFLLHRGEVVFLLLNPGIVVYLVEDNHRWLVGTVQFLQRVLYHLYLLFKVRVGDVYYVEQQVGLAGLVERTLEGVYQVGRQLSDESYGICEEERQIVYHHLSYGSIEGGKELVFGEHLALGEQVHDGTLAHVGISYQCHTDHSAAVLALGVLLLVDFGKSLLEQAHSAQDDTAVHLELGFTRSTKTYGTLSASGA